VFDGGIADSLKRIADGLEKGGQRSNQVAGNIFLAGQDMKVPVLDIKIASKSAMDRFVAMEEYMREVRNFSQASCTIGSKFFDDIKIMVNAIVEEWLGGSETERSAISVVSSFDEDEVSSDDLSIAFARRILPRIRKGMPDIVLVSSISEEVRNPILQIVQLLFEAYRVFGIRGREDVMELQRVVREGPGMDVSSNVELVGRIRKWERVVEMVGYVVEVQRHEVGSGLRCITGKIRSLLGGNSACRTRLDTLEAEAEIDGLQPNEDKVAGLIKLVNEYALNKVVFRKANRDSESGSQKECRYYQSGKCFKGKKCLFKHVESVKEGLHVDINASAASGSEVAAGGSMGQYVAAASDRKKACREWVRDGECTKKGCGLEHSTHPFFVHSPSLTHSLHAFFLSDAAATY
jgi:hypothetical protein